jgi:hypothetical protein
MWVDYRWGQNRPIIHRVREASSGTMSACYPLDAGALSMNKADLTTRFNSYDRG